MPVFCFLCEEYCHFGNVYFCNCCTILKVLMLKDCHVLIFRMGFILISCLLLLHRFANEDGVRSLCTTSVRLNEKKTGDASSNHNDKPNENRESEPTETPPLIDQKVEVDKNTIIMAKENKKPVKSETDNGIITQSQPTVNTEQQKQAKAQTSKSGKESLLDLLGVMKVEVTNKRKVKGVKFRQSYEPLSTSKPAVMESTISMFQQATVEASTQR